MQEKILIDSHKLIYHPERVTQWLKGEMIYPIEMEVGLSGGCNHRCTFCALDYVEYKQRFLDADVLVQNLVEIHTKGLKSIIYSGEGEPLLNPNVESILNKTKEIGIDAALSTNGVLLEKSLSENCLQALSWIRFSVAGATESTYEAIHRSPKGDFQRVLQNLEDAVTVRNERSLQTTLGVQALLLPENFGEVVDLARIIRKIGLDYLTIKPYSQHPNSINTNEIDYSSLDDMKKELYEYETDKFKIYFRDNSILNVSVEKCYDKCRGLPFMVHMDAGGNVFPCCAFVGDMEFRYGNIYEQKIVEFWESERKNKIQSLFRGAFLKQKCRKACRMDEINKYLQNLENGVAHVNFI